MMKYKNAKGEGGEKMKKKIGICSIVLGFLLILKEVIVQVTFKLSMNKAIKEIGGADGPTSVFVAGRLGNSAYVILSAGVIFMLIGIILLIRNREK